LLLAIFVSFPLARTQKLSPASVPFFPKLAKNHSNDVLKHYWYTSQLQALREKSFLSLARTKSAESYRFLWLRTFNHPVVVRLDVKADGTSTLTKKVGSGKGGFSPGILVEDEAKTLTRDQTHAFLSKVTATDFWSSENPVDDQRGTDGSQWIIEAVKQGRYHIVDRWMPREGVARDLGMMLAFDLAKMTLPSKEI
jgi:hypothetical protein